MEGNDLYDREIKKGEVAPFKGFLVPNDVYRFYHSEVERASMLEKEFIDLKSEVDKAPPPYWTMFIISIGAGALGYCLGKMEKCF